MSALHASLAAAALLIGLTGAWSPCGFSMVETIGLAGDRSRRWTTAAACATFAPGALVGGVGTFGFLAALGDLVHGAGGRAALAAGAAIAAAAAIAEARGLRIAPQIRRQLPERWRWTMPLPLAAALYGVLLGLGFTTFVLSFGVWALAGISFAVGDPAAGALIGAAFGLGRAIPVLAVAPVVDRPLGNRCVAAMAERPALYRLFRLGDGVALAVVGVALATSTSASAAHVEALHAADPSAAGKALAYQRGDRGAILRFAGHLHGLPGRDPALGGPFAAVILGDQVKILDRFSRHVIGSAAAPHAEAVAISRGWLAYLTVRGGRYSLLARRIEHPDRPGRARRIASAHSPATIGRPTVDAGRLFFAVSRPRVSAIRRQSLGSGKRGTVARSRTDQLLNPSVLGKHLAYVRVSRARQSPQKTSPPKLRQRLVSKRIGRGHPHRLYSQGPGRILWTISLSARRAFMTLLGGGPRVISVRR